MGSDVKRAVQGENDRFSPAQAGRFLLANDRASKKIIMQLMTARPFFERESRQDISTNRPWPVTATQSAETGINGSARATRPANA